MDPIVALHENLHQIYQLGEKLKQACLKMMAAGWKIEPAIYNIPSEKKCCPLVALAMTEDKWEALKMATGRELAWALGIDQNHLNDFTAGFDQDPKHIHANLDYFMLGRRMHDWWEKQQRSVKDLRHQVPE